MLNEVIKPVLPAAMVDKKTKYHINPTGRFVTGGPMGDCGLTGRKIIVDTYGGYSRHGGGALSGKDPTKVDRSACYMARYVAKNIVAAGLASKVEVQIAYAIGVAEPVSVMADTFGTGTIPNSQITELIRGFFKLTPKGIIETLDLRRPIYRPTAAYGHFGRSGPGFTWERTDKAEAIRKEAGSRGAVAVSTPNRRFTLRSAVSDRRVAWTSAGSCRRICRGGSQTRPLVTQPSRRPRRRRFSCALCVSAVKRFFDSSLAL